MINQRKTIRAWRLPALVLLIPVVTWAEDPQLRPPAEFLFIENAITTALDGNPNLAGMQARYEALAGLVPIMLSTATGSDVTHRIAAPMLGGMATVLLLNLLVLPVIYSLVLQVQEGGFRSRSELEESP